MYSEPYLACTFLWLNFWLVVSSGENGREPASKAETSILFVILSQSNAYDGEKASKAYDAIQKQAEGIEDLRFKILLTHTEFKNVVGSWAIFPLIKSLYKMRNGDFFNWIWLGEVDTTLNVTSLLEYLMDFDEKPVQFVGRALQDKSPTIIHHFFGYENPSIPFFYPDFAAGIVLFWKVWEQLANLPQRDTGFTIDAKHEFAKLLHEVVGSKLTNAPKFCLLCNETDCISRYAPSFHICEQKVGNRDVFFAVKTFSGNHRSRITVIKKTWGKVAMNINYYSDQNDESIPTISLGIKNTERGHCAKTFAILKHYVTQQIKQETRWIFIADDDTLLSVPRLTSLLSCYDVEERIIIGERYGYGFSSDGKEGYDYPTGGAGMVFTRKAAEDIVAYCYCPSADSPDDMIIGVCARRLQIPVVHSAAFHQARPIDYSELYLQRLQAISFHKFEEVDPYEVYEQFLCGESSEMKNILKHGEL